MPWARTDWMSERVKFIAAYLGHEASFSELCRCFGVSRKTGYKWVTRYEADGVEALVDRSRAPHSHPRAVTERIVKAVVGLRRAHPHWGPRKLRIVLGREQPKSVLPAASTIGEILKRRGLVRKRRRVRRSSPYGTRLRAYEAPNAVWCADFKGCFPVGGERCHPLTISDGFSRYLLRCQATEASSIRTRATRLRVGVSRVRIAGHDPYGQWGSVLDVGTGRTLAPRRLVDSARGSTRTNPARATGPERPS